MPTAAVRIEKEVRFAVVMYGGVSLAIYINGVAQELFQLARATATDPGVQDIPGKLLHETVAGTAATYRRLAQVLSMAREDREALERGLAADPLALEKGLPEDECIRVKFVIDAISGTSAGGINGIFLGKALARNADIEELRRLWVDEGDILKLINDRKSVADLGGFPSTDKPASLLNGQRMYRRLVEALDDMEPKAAQAGAVASGYCDELDVFVTATDVNGLPVFLRLSDGVVTERRHKNVFHFRHRQEGSDVEHDDFGREHNPMLAFAARCTSSFPVAFEPMRLETVGEVLGTMATRRDQGRLGRDGSYGGSFFAAYRRAADAPPGQANPEWYEFWKRPFCDGGYLDNKPFSYAIDALSRRVPRYAGERKLIYIEPDPDHAEAGRRPLATPNALENAVLAKTLSGYETIREDLRRVLERNRLVERVERLLRGSDDDVEALKALFDSRESDKAFLEGDLDLMIQRYGPAYGGYHRLKVGDLTDEISDWLGAALGLDQAHVFGLRLIVSAWRETRYSPVRADGKETENQFLHRFDVLYRIRRLRFAMRHIDSLRTRAFGMAAGAAPGGARAVVEDALRRCGIDPPAEPWSPDGIGPILKVLRDELRGALSDLVKTRAALGAGDGAHPLAGAVLGWFAAMRSLPGSPAEPAARTRELLEGVLRGRTLKERSDAAKDVLAQPEIAAAIEAIVAAAGECMDGCRRRAAARCEEAFAASLASQSGWPRKAVELIRSYYERYQGYDFVSFPIIYATDIGEEIATTEVIRISPDDARSLVDPGRGDARRKLAGTALQHFGAFFEQSWRKNDMLWGRLDGAERLIVSLLPTNCPNIAAALLRDAQKRILDEHHGLMGAHAVLGFASELAGKLQEPSPATRRMLDFAASAAAPSRLDRETRRQLSAAARESRAMAALVEEAVRHRLGADGLLAFFASPDGYEVDRRLTPTTAAEAMSRATTVFGKVLDGIGGQYRSGSAQRFGAWLSRLGRLLWGMVEVAMPRSLDQLLWRHALQVAYVLEVVLVLGGLLSGHSDATKLGTVLLVLTALLHVAVWLIRDWFAGRATAAFVLKTGAGLLVAGLAAFGAYRLWTEYPAIPRFACATAGFDCAAAAADKR